MKSNPRHPVYQRAQQLMNKGDWEQGIKLLENHLTTHGNDLPCLNLVGIAHARNGHYTQAEHYFVRCLQGQPGNIEVLLQLGKLYRVMKRNDDAMSVLSAIVTLNPKHYDALVLLGQIVFEKGEKEGAIRAFTAALELCPNDEDAFRSLYVALYTCGFYREAAGVAEKAIATLSGRTWWQFRNDLVLAYREAGLMQASREAAEALLPDIESSKVQAARDLRLDVYNNYAATLMELNEEQLAEVYCKKALGIDPNRVEPLVNLSKLAERREDARMAIEYYERAIASNPDSSKLHHHFATFLRSAGRPDLAMPHHEAAVAANPQDTEARFYMSATQLMLGNLEAGWRYWPLRWLQYGVGTPSPFAINEWTGTPSKGSSILVYREQGIGDELCFLSCLDDLKAHFEHITLQCHPKLTALIQRSFPGIRLIHEFSELSSDEVAGFEWQIALGSLPAIFRQDLNSFPRLAQLLQADGEKTSSYKTWLLDQRPMTNLNVGIAWRSSVLAAGRHALYPYLENWGPLFAIPGITWINLQVGECSEEIASAETMFGVEILDFSEIDHYNDLDASAALMGACDLVIGGDTSSLFLSAALGVPTLRLTCGQDFFTLGQNPYPWLPALTNLPRQFGAGWEQPVSVATHILQTLVAEHQEKIFKKH